MRTFIHSTTANTKRVVCCTFAQLVLGITEYLRLFRESCKMYILGHLVFRLLCFLGAMSSSSGCVFWERKAGIASAARTRAMTAHGMPEHPATATAVDVLNDDTDAIQFCEKDFCICCLHCLRVSEQRCVNLSWCFDGMPWRAALCGLHPLYSHMLIQ